MKVEIELISGEGLRVNGKPVKKKTFCVVTINEKSKNCKPEEFGGSNPIWTEKIEMEMMNAKCIISIGVFYLTSGGAKKNIGNAKIPANDFMGGLSPLGHLNFLSYRLRDEYGDKTGIVNLSIMVKHDGDSKVSACSSQAVVAGNSPMWRPMRASSSSSMAVGVPVWCSYQR